MEEALLDLLDDYPIHQTVRPIARTDSEDRNKYDRYWFNGYDRGGDWYFGIGMGRYPNLGILDCALSIVTSDGEQHSFFGSRRTPAEPTELAGTWSGVISVDGNEVRVESQPGTKDRSWGLRVIGAPDPGVAPVQTVPQFWFLWNPVHWNDHCTHVGLFEYEDGHPWHTDAAIVPAYDGVGKIPGVEDPAIRHFRRATHAIEYRPGTRWARAATVTIHDTEGGDRVIELDPVLRFHMRGIGYRHPEWGHGLWKGELEIGRDSFRPDDLDPLGLDCSHVQQVVRARCRDEEGIGVLERYSLGPHAPSGFNDFDDGAAG